MRLHAFAGGRVVYADVSPTSVALAQQAGLEAFVPEVDLIESFQSGLPQDAEVVVDATCVTSVLPSATAVAKAKPWNDIPISGARVIIQGSYSADLDGIISAVPSPEAAA